jgi:hypothetical protein
MTLASDTAPSVGKCGEAHSLILVVSPFKVQDGSVVVDLAAEGLTSGHEILLSNERLQEVAALAKNSSDTKIAWLAIAGSIGWVCNRGNKASSSDNRAGRLRSWR